MSEDINELIKKARLRSQVLEKKTEENETEEFLRTHPNLRPGITPISAEYIYLKYKQWKRGYPTERRWFFRRFPKSFKRKEYTEGTYYLLDKRLIIMTEEEERLYVKKVRSRKKA